MRTRDDSRARIRTTRTRARPLITPVELLRPLFVHASVKLIMNTYSGDGARVATRPLRARLIESDGFISESTVDDLSKRPRRRSPNRLVVYLVLTLADRGLSIVSVP